MISLVCSSLPFYLFKTESFVGSDTKVVVTEADVENRVVTELDGKPAMIGYAEAAGVDVKELNFDYFANHPTAVMLDGQFYTRSILPKRGEYLRGHPNALQFGCAIEEGLVLTLVNPVDVVEDLETAFTEMRRKIGEPSLVLGFDCLYRKSQYAKTVTENRIAGLMQRNNVIGFHTYGEQFGSLHMNQTFTAVAFGKDKNDG